MATELENINLGTQGNDGTGDALRIGGQKINDNFQKVANLSRTVESGNLQIYKRTVNTGDAGTLETGDMVTGWINNDTFLQLAQYKTGDPTALASYDVLTTFDATGNTSPSSLFNNINTGKWGISSLSGANSSFLQSDNLGVISRSASVVETFTAVFNDEINTIFPTIPTITVTVRQLGHLVFYNADFASAITNDFADQANNFLFIQGSIFNFPATVPVPIAGSFSGSVSRARAALPDLTNESGDCAITEIGATTLIVRYGASLPGGGTQSLKISATGFYFTNDV